MPATNCTRRQSYSPCVFGAAYPDVWQHRQWRTRSYQLKLPMRWPILGGSVMPKFDANLAALPVASRWQCFWAVTVCAIAVVQDQVLLHAFQASRRGGCSNRFAANHRRRASHWISRNTVDSTHYPGSAGMCLANLAGARTARRAIRDWACCTVSYPRQPLPPPSSRKGARY